MWGHCTVYGVHEANCHEGAWRHTSWMIIPHIASTIMYSSHFLSLLFSAQIISLANHHVTIMVCCSWGMCYALVTTSPAARPGAKALGHQSGGFTELESSKTTELGRPADNRSNEWEHSSHAAGFRWPLSTSRQWEGHPCDLKPHVICFLGHSEMLSTEADVWHPLKAFVRPELKKRVPKDGLVLSLGANDGGVLLHLLEQPLMNTQGSCTRSP